MWPVSAFRALQGISTTGYYCIGVLIINDCVPLSERGKHHVVIEGLVMVGQGAGPFLGGIISEKLGWRYIFFLSLPMLGLLFICEMLCLPNRSAKNVRWRDKLSEIDYVGAVLSISGTTLLLVGFNIRFGHRMRRRAELDIQVGLLRGGIEVPWRSGAQIAILTLSACLLLLFLGWEGFTRSPLIPLRLFANRTVLAIHIFAVTYFGALTIINFFVPMFLQSVKGYSPSLAGAVFLVFGASLRRFYSHSAVTSIAERTLSGRNLSECGSSWSFRFTREGS